MASPNMLGTYAGNDVYTEDEKQLQTLKDSGITTVIPWTIHIAHENGESPMGKRGDLSLNATYPLASEGQYWGDPMWNSRLQRLKTGGTVNRIILSIGCCGQFNKIADLGTDHRSILYQNFQAIRTALPAIDGIDFDNESNYGDDTTVDFALMLSDIGFKEVTFCPYVSEDTWINWLQAINKKRPGFVTGFHLQCYSGGAGNDPVDWMKALKGIVPNPPGFVFPGLASRYVDNNGGGGDCPEEMTRQLKTWNEKCQKEFGVPMQGAWLWTYDSILENAEKPEIDCATKSFDAYVQALKAGWA